MTAFEGSRAGLLSVCAAAMLALPGSAAAQVDLGVHGRFSEVRGESWGVGGGLSYLRPRGTDLLVGVSAYGTFYWPDCGASECDAWAGDFLATVKRNGPGGTRPYAGAGAKYVDVSVEAGGNQVSGDAWGFMLLVGSEYGMGDQPIVPFIEFDMAFMSGASDVWDLTLGIRTARGGRR